MGFSNKAHERLDSWAERRKRIIGSLNEAADGLTTLNEVTHAADFIGTGVSATSAAFATGAVLLSAPVSIPTCGVITAVGTAVSVGSRSVKKYSTSERVKSLQMDLEEDAKAVVELEGLMKTLQGSVERLKKIETVLKYIFQVGVVGVEQFIAGKLGDKETKQVLQIVNQIVNNDGFITYMVNKVDSAASIVSNPTSEKSDWNYFIKCSAEIASSLTMITLGGRIVEAVEQSQCSLAVHGISAVTVCFNLLTIKKDVEHLLDIGLKTKQPEIVHQIRQLANYLQEQLDKVSKPQTKKTD